jgi:hypothetical protein
MVLIDAVMCFKHILDIEYSVELYSAFSVVVDFQTTNRNQNNFIVAVARL